MMLHWNYFIMRLRSILVAINLIFICTVNRNEHLKIHMFMNAHWKWSLNLNIVKPLIREEKKFGLFFWRPLAFINIEKYINIGFKHCKSYLCFTMGNGTKKVRLEPCYHGNCKWTEFFTQYTYTNTVILSSSYGSLFSYLSFFWIKSKLDVWKQNITRALQYMNCFCRISNIRSPSVASYF